jgi:hypothetical protein
MNYCVKSSWPIIPLIVTFFALPTSAIELLQGFPFNTEFEMQTGPKVADFDLDGNDEIVVGTDAGPGVPGQEYVYIIRGDGSLLLEKPLPDGIRAPTAIGDIDDNGTLDIVAAWLRVRACRSGPARALTALI